MAFIGRLFGSIANVYREMNPATLTGAIDVIVVRQPDGSLRASPFHVRFGKVGVFRSREKVVDITLNGEPVDLKMKLGDAGEAFFVELKEDESSVAPHLCTSPLPGDETETIENGMATMKIESVDQDREDSTRQDDPQMDDLLAPMESSMEISVELETGNDFGFGPASFRDQRDADISDESSSFDTDSSASAKPRQHRYKKRKSISKRSPGSQPAAAEPYSEDIFAMEMDHFDERKPKWSSDEEEALDAVNRLVQSSTASSASPNVDIVGSPSQARKISRSLPQDTAKSTRTLENDIRGQITMGVKNDERADGRVFYLGDDLGELHPFSDGDLSPPMGSPIRRPFSPQSDSELLERPSFTTAKDRRYSNINWSWGQLPHVKGDQDKLLRVSEDADTTATSVTLSTAPEFSTTSAVEARPSGASLASSNRSTAISLASSSLRSREGAIGHSLPNDFSPPLLTTPPDLTLEELERMRPEVKALYLTPTSRNASVERQSFPGSGKEEDANSARGSPQAQSPLPYDGSAASSGFGSDYEGQTKGNRSRNGSGYRYGKSPYSALLAAGDSTEPCRSETPPALSLQDGRTSRQRNPSQSSCQLDHPDIKLSLCGPLKSGSTISDEWFMLSHVTFDKFCNDPDEFLANPDLVFKIGDRYFNWAVAAPMLLSMGAYMRPLPSKAVHELLDKHQPQNDGETNEQSNRKRASGMASWFSWGSRTDENVENEENNNNNNNYDQEAYLSSSAPTMTSPMETYPSTLPTHQESDVDDDFASSSVEAAAAPDATEQRGEYVKSIRLTPEQLAKLPLKEGANDVVFSVTTSYQGTSRAEASIFLWNWDDKLIVSDIDGTITKSDVLGQFLPLVGKDWSQDGITALYRHIVDNGYRLIYLSARAIGQAGITRSYLQSVRQESNALPNGPVLLSPSSLIHAFHREVIEKKPEEFKIGCLKDIAKLFPWRQTEIPTLEADMTIKGVVEDEENLSEANTPFFAGFGNKTNDVTSYRAVGVPLARIFTVNPRGEICHELMKNYRTTYSSLREMADHAFPLILKGAIAPLPEIYNKALKRLQLIDSPKTTRSLSVPGIAGSFPVDIPSSFGSAADSAAKDRRQRASTSNTPKCYVFEGEQYSSFVYWREPMPGLDAVISGLDQ